MAHDYDRRDRPATGEERAEKRVGESDTAASDSAEFDATGSASETPPELRWAQLLEPRHALEIGQDGRAVASHYHEGRDTWNVLLETYDEK